MADDNQFEATKGFNEAIATGFEHADFKAAVASYTEDAVVLPARGQLIKGRNDIAAFWNSVRNRFTGMVFTPGEFKLLAPDVARETGTYVLSAEGGEAAQSRGKYLFVWQKVDGSWLLESSIWSRNTERAQGQAQGAPRQGQGQGRQGAGQGRAQAGGAQQGGGQAGYGQGGGNRQGGAANRQGGVYRQGGGQGGTGQRGGIAGGRGGIGGGGSGIGGGGGGGRRNQQPGRGGRGGGQGQGGGAQGGGAQGGYGQGLGLYSNNDE